MFSTTWPQSPLKIPLGSSTPPVASVTLRVQPKLLTLAPADLACWSLHPSPAPFFCSFTALPPSGHTFPPQQRLCACRSLCLGNSSPQSAQAHSAARLRSPLRCLRLWGAFSNTCWERNTLPSPSASMSVPFALCYVDFHHHWHLLIYSLGGICHPSPPTGMCANRDCICVTRPASPCLEQHLGHLGAQ